MASTMYIHAEQHHLLHNIETTVQNLANRYANHCATRTYLFDVLLSPTSRHLKKLLVQLPGI